MDETTRTVVGGVPSACESVDEIIGQWHQERPDLRVAPIAVITRPARVRTHLDAALTEVFAGFDLTPADFHVLITLRLAGAPYELGQSRLMDALDLTSSTMSLRLARLEQREVVVREQDPGDKRGFTVRLTAHGADLFDWMAPVHLESEDVPLSAPTRSDPWPWDTGARCGRARESSPIAASHRVPCARKRRVLCAAGRRAALALRATTGLLVTRVDPDTRAGRAGIRLGALIIGCGGAPVPSPDDLIRDDGSVCPNVLRGEGRLDMRFDGEPG